MNGNCFPRNVKSINHYMMIIREVRVLLLMVWHLTEMHIDERLLVLEELPPSGVSNDRTLGLVNLAVLWGRPKGRLVIRTVHKLWEGALPAPAWWILGDMHFCICDRAGQGHGVGGHCCAGGLVCSRSAVFASGVLAFSGVGGVVEAQGFGRCLTQEEYYFVCWHGHIQSSFMEWKRQCHRLL